MRVLLLLCVVNGVLGNPPMCLNSEPSLSEPLCKSKMCVECKGDSKTRKACLPTEPESDDPSCVSYSCAANDAAKRQCPCHCNKNRVTSLPKVTTSRKCKADLEVGKTCVMDEMSKDQQDVIEKLHNDFRKKHGACPLVWNKDLAKMARESSKLIPYCDQTTTGNPHTTGLGDEITLDGKKYRRKENLLRGYGNINGDVYKTGSKKSSGEFDGVDNWNFATDGTSNVGSWYCDEAGCFDYTTMKEKTGIVDANGNPVSAAKVKTGHMTAMLDTTAVAIGCAACEYRGSRVFSPTFTNYYSLYTLMCQYAVPFVSQYAGPSAPPGKTFEPTPAPTPSPSAITLGTDSLLPPNAKQCSGHGDCPVPAGTHLAENNDVCKCHQEPQPNDKTKFVYGGRRCSKYGIVHGDPHWTNIHGRRFDFHGDPDTPYTLYGDSEVHVTGWTGYCWSGAAYVTCLRRVSIWRKAGDLVEFTVVGETETRTGRVRPVVTLGCEGEGLEVLLDTLDDGVGAQATVFPGVRFMSPRSYVSPTQDKIRIGLYEEGTGVQKAELGISYYPSKDMKFQHLTMSMDGYEIPEAATGILVDDSFTRHDRTTWPVDSLECEPEVWPCATCPAAVEPMRREATALSVPGPTFQGDTPTPSEALALCPNDAERERAEGCCAKAKTGCKGFLGQCLFDECAVGAGTLGSGECLESLDDALKAQDKVEKKSCYCEGNLAVNLVTGDCTACKRQWYPTPSDPASPPSTTAACSRFCDELTTCKGYGLCNPEGLCLCGASTVPTETCEEPSSCEGAAVVELDGVAMPTAPTTQDNNNNNNNPFDLTGIPQQFTGDGATVSVPGVLPLPAGSEIKLSCCNKAADDVCSFVVSVFNCAPCSVKKNGGLPHLLVPLYEAGSCAPKFGPHQEAMVSFKVEVQRGESVTLPTTTDPARYLAVFAKSGTFGDPWCPARKKSVGCGSDGSAGPCLPNVCKCYD